MHCLLLVRYPSPQWLLHVDQLVHARVSEQPARGGGRAGGGGGGAVGGSGRVGRAGSGGRAAARRGGAALAARLDLHVGAVHQLLAAMAYS